MSARYVFPEPPHIDFDKIGHTGKFFPTTSDKTGHLIINAPLYRPDQEEELPK